MAFYTIADSADLSYLLAALEMAFAIVLEAPSAAPGNTGSLRKEWCKCMKTKGD